MSFEDKIRWLSVSINDLQLIELKRQFKTVINSKRKYSQINSFVDLIGILIARGIVGADDVSVLDQISLQYLGRNFGRILEPQVNDATSNVQSSQLEQTSTLKTRQKSVEVKAASDQTGHSGMSTEQKINAIPEEVIDHIVGNLNENQWRRFVRNLNVGEEKLTDERSMRDKVRKAFVIFLQNTESARQWPLLEVALESIRRLDLRDYCELLIKQQ